MEAATPQLSRSQRRARVKDEKKKQQRPVRNKGSSVINAVRHAVFRKHFEGLLVTADGLCASSSDVTDIAGVVGRLLFVTAKAVSLEELEIEEPEVIRALTLAESTLAQIVKAGDIDAQQRKDLLAGLDCLEALSRAVSIEALDMSSWLLDRLIAKGPDFGDDEIPRLLERIAKKHLG